MDWPTSGHLGTIRTMAEVLVVRHAQASLMRDDYDQLCERGHRQSRALADHLGCRFNRTVDVPLRSMIHGPARRHKETANHLMNVLRRETSKQDTIVVREDPRWDEFDLRGLLQAGAASKDREFLASLES